MDSKSVFQPILICLQIVCLQCFYYVSMGTLWAISHILFGHGLSLSHLFTDAYVNFVSWRGWCEILCTLAAAVAGAYLLSIIVERAKRCVDFTFTLFFIHIWSCTFFQEFPLVWEWWFLQVVASVLMATLGEYWSSLQELKDIPAYTRAPTRETEMV